MFVADIALCLTKVAAVSGKGGSCFTVCLAGVAKRGAAKTARILVILQYGLASTRSIKNSCVDVCKVLALI